MGAAPDVTDATFRAEVIERTEPVLVDFWAPWCGPCRALSPILEEIAEERGLRVVKVNTDDNQQTAAQFGVLSLPTMILFKAGEPVTTIIGAYPKKRLDAQLERALH